MKKDTKLSAALHVILHMTEVDGPMTSDRLARAMRTNPVVVRRMMAGLRERGFVTSEKGHGGGWKLNCDLKTTSLGDIYSALGSPDCIALTHRDENTSCLVELAVNVALKSAFEEAEALLLARFDEVMLADLSDDFHTRFAALKQGSTPHDESKSVS